VSAGKKLSAKQTHWWTETANTFRISRATTLSVAIAHRADRHTGQMILPVAIIAEVSVNGIRRLAKDPFEIRGAPMEEFD
jgi:hypothetical protein